LRPVLVSLRAELLVLRHRPAVWALVLAMPFNMLIISYVTEYVVYLTSQAGPPRTAARFGQDLSVLLAAALPPP